MTIIDTLDDIIEEGVYEYNKRLKYRKLVDAILELQDKGIPRQTIINLQNMLADVAEESSDVGRSGVEGV